MLILSLQIFDSKAQQLPDNLKEITINKKVSDYSDTFDLKTPFSSFLTLTCLRINGNDSLFKDMSSLSVQGKWRPIKTISEKEKKSLLETTIHKILIYKDTVAAVIVDNAGFFTFWCLYFERGVWLNAGEAIGGNSVLETQKIFLENAPIHLDFIRKIAQLEKVSTDTLAFIDYLKNHKKQPKEFLIDVLKTHKIVLYGEIHFREISWNLMRELIKLPEFHQVTGTVFLELSSSCQSELDMFFNNQTKKDPNIILNIFRKEEMRGWNDKGMYEFLLDLWEVNKQLPAKKKIKVIATDFPRPFYSTITSKEQYTNFFNDLPDRNVSMATIIENHIKSSSDKRNCLFIVGYAHAYKSAALLRGGFQRTGQSAGALLVERFSKNEVFSIFTHSPIITNNGYVYGKLRKGLFDYVFAELGNKPVAFNLHNNPFGHELFDASFDICFEMSTKTFKDNFDGYIFLAPLSEELVRPPLYELYTDDFILEIKRRAAIINAENGDFYGMKIKDLDRSRLILELEYETGNKRWKNID